jgi:hypothetical protein
VAGDFARDLRFPLGVAQQHLQVAGKRELDAGVGLLSTADHPMSLANGKTRTSLILNGDQVSAFAFSAVSENELTCGAVACL